MQQLPEFDEKTLRPILPKDQLQDGAYYLGRCRNASIARWNAAGNCFFHWREKFGKIFIERIFHPMDESTYDVFRVVELLSDPKFEIPFEPAKFAGNAEDLHEYNVKMWTRI